MKAISPALRRLQAELAEGKDSTGGPSSPSLWSYHHGYHLKLALAQKTDRHRPDAVSTLAQMLQAEDAGIRWHLVKVLGSVPGPEASTALAQRAIFDLAADVREAAVQVLERRPPKEYRPQLLAALRYPWPPAADHAAEALVALGDREAVPALRELLSRPDPAAPFRDQDGKWVVSEVVRVNHLGNCLLCHAPSTSPGDPVRGFVPSRNQPLPPAYYASRGGDFIRADVTYLRQDFSVSEPVKDHGRWPGVQRFDYLVRTRELTRLERAVLPAAAADAGAARQGAADRAVPCTYPQGEAVLFALRHLTAGADRDAGHSDRSGSSAARLRR
jgi:hypothetical protein